jgi:hypothetical protein
MLADYLSRLPGAKENIASISAFDLFQADLYELQMKDEILQASRPSGTLINGLQQYQNKIRPTTQP